MRKGELVEETWAELLLSMEAGIGVELSGRPCREGAIFSPRSLISTVSFESVTTIPVEDEDVGDGASTTGFRGAGTKELTNDDALDVAFGEGRAGPAGMTITPVSSLTDGAVLTVTSAPDFFPIPTPMLSLTLLP